MPITQFISYYCKGYKNFLKKHIAEKRPPFFFILLWIYGAGLMLDRMAAQGAVDDWASAWGIVLLLGIVSGYIGYFILGSWYHLRVWLAGGEKKWRISCNLWLYAGMPIFSVWLLLKIMAMAQYGNAYFKMAMAPFSALTLVLLLLAVLYSVYLSYTGVVLIQKTKPVRSVIFFIALPVLFYFSLYGFLGLASMNS
ncbi:hypothetical protein JXA05_04105 [Candidatus Peregrinibacteria bacterium]|nr:hypothetical protein [Candidatus Peregrinibacteria bacterium]